MRIVADSSSLILLSKCGLLEIVCKRFQVLAPMAVVNEVACKSLATRHPDAALISTLFEQGVILVQDPSATHFVLPISLHTGEKQALILAKELAGSVLATDDGKAIKAAKFLRVPFIISPKMVAELFRLGTISLRDARRSLERLGQIGRYSPDIIAGALVALMEQEDGKADDNQDT